MLHTEELVLMGCKLPKGILPAGMLIPEGLRPAGWLLPKGLLPEEGLFLNGEIPALVAEITLLVVWLLRKGLLPGGLLLTNENLPSAEMLLLNAWLLEIVLLLAEDLVSLSTGSLYAE
jgi:hypothetical protein